MQGVRKDGKGLSQEWTCSPLLASCWAPVFPACLPSLQGASPQLPPCATNSVFDPLVTCLVYWPVFHYLNLAEIIWSVCKMESSGSFWKLQVLWPYSRPIIQTQEGNIPRQPIVCCIALLKGRARGTPFDSRHNLKDSSFSHSKIKRTNDVSWVLVPGTSGFLLRNKYALTFGTFKPYKWSCFSLYPGY